MRFFHWASSANFRWHGICTILLHFHNSPMSSTIWHMYLWLANGMGYQNNYLLWRQCDNDT